MMLNAIRADDATSKAKYILWNGSLQGKDLCW